MDNGSSLDFEKELDEYWQSVCLSRLNLQSLKSHEHETWHVGSPSDLDVQRPSEILIFDFFRPSWIFRKSPISLYRKGLKSHDHEIWHVGPLRPNLGHVEARFSIFLGGHLGFSKIAYIAISQRFEVARSRNLACMSSNCSRYACAL